MKRIIAILVIFLLLSTTLAFSINTVTSSKANRQSPEKQLLDNFPHLSKIIQLISNRFQSFKEKRCSFDHRTLDEVDDFTFSPEDAELKDDAFHGADTLHFTEWWYFDAKLNKGYSIQMIIQVISLLDWNLVSTKLNIYKDGELKVNQDKIYLPDDFYASTDIPLIKLDGKQVMKGYMDHGNFVYDISLDIDGVSANLQFVGCAKGWKGDVATGGWAVILPKAEVSGTITINDLEMEVIGVGYHDHNWKLTAQAGINFGWCWGKVNSGDITAVWSSIMKTCTDNEPLLVINKGNEEYINIEPENIQFIIKEITIKNWWLVPNNFVIVADTDDVSVYIEMTVLDTHHTRIGPIKYWRYHVKCLGYITIDSQKQIVDEMQIQEFIRFR